MTLSLAIAAKSGYGAKSLALTAVSVRYWYVNSVSGDDDNDGLSPGAAFASIAKLLTVMEAGDRVRLARGSTWREQLTVPGANCVVVAYGSGNAPMLDCSDAVSAGAWSKTGGYTNIYQFTGATNYVGNEPSFQSVWEDDVRLTRAASLVALDGAAGQYFCANDDTTAPVIYVHATDSGNPASNGSVYEYAARNAGVYAFSIAGLTLTGVSCRRNLSNNGSIVVGRSAVLTDCTAYEGGKHNLLYADGCTLVRVIANDAYYTASATMFVYNENTPAGLGITHEDCDAVMPDTDGLGYIYGFYGHNNTSGAYGDVVYTRCSASNCGVGFSGAHADLVYNDCETDTCIVGYQPSDPTATYTINDPMHVEAIAGRFNRIVSVAGANITVNVSGGTCRADKSSSNTGMFYDNNNAGVVFNVTGGTFETTSDTAAGSNIFYSEVATEVNASNNDYTIGATGGRVYLMTHASATLDSDYNNFSREATQNYYRGTNYATITAWKAAGQDANSTVG